VFGDPTDADAILDHLIHNAHRVDLAGEYPTTISHQGLTNSLPRATESAARRAPAARRHHVGTASDMISQSPGDIAGISSPLPIAPANVQ
jgi:hypothetical protein